MRSFGREVAILLCCVSCGFDDTDTTVGNDSSDESTVASVTGGATQPTSGDGGVTSSGEPSTGGDVSTTNAPEEADETTTGSADVLTTTEDASDTGHDDGVGSQTTGDEVVPYGSCPCADGHETCITFSSEGVAVANACYLLGCTVDEDCPAGMTGTATPVCVTTLFRQGACALDCNAGEICPDEMLCYEVVLGGGVSMFRCAWPAE
jgi:hypothetical protein